MRNWIKTAKYPLLKQNEKPGIRIDTDARLYTYKAQSRIA
jgi:hypothetical protein